MKYITTSTIILAGLLVSLIACQKEKTVTPEAIDYAYHAHIHSPNHADKHVDDTIHIHLEAESHTGETVHHARVRIYNKADNTEVYNQPNKSHVHEIDGKYELHDDFVLSNANGIVGHTNWVIEAKVWAEATGEGEVIETVEFHVHP